jgi:phage/plasmid-associated DNA primase
MALAYIRSNWVLMPVWGVNDEGECACGSMDCVGPGKHLVGEGGVIVRDEETANREWSSSHTYPRGIALKTGRDSGILVIDVPPGAEPPDAVAYSRRAYSTTPSGGHHYFYTITDNDILVPAGDGGLSAITGSGLRVVGEGGYAFLPSGTEVGAQARRWVDNAELGILDQDLKAMLTSAGILQVGSDDTFDVDTPWLVSPGSGATARRSSTPLGVARTVVDQNGHLIRSVLSVSTSNSDVLVWKDGWNSGADADASIQNMILGTMSNPIRQWFADAAAVNDTAGVTALRALTKKIRGGESKRAMLDFVRSDERIKTREEEWDVQDHLLGLPGGRVLNLRNQEVLIGREARDARVRYRTDVDYIPGAYDPILEEFLESAHIYNDAPGGLDFILDVAAATLAGKKIIGDKIVILYGPTGSGKSTFVDLVASLMGMRDEGYASVISHSLVVGTGLNNDSYSLAKTRGSRMFTLDELPQGKPLKEDMLKTLSGSTVLAVRQIHKAEETIRNNGTLWIATNEPPITADDALWRRFLFVNFPIKRDDGTIDDRIKRTMLDPHRPLARQALLAKLVERTPRLFAAADSKVGLSKGFEIHPAATAYARTIRSQSDPFLAWREASLEHSPGNDSVSLTTAYMSYRRFYDQEGFSGREGQMTMTSFRDKTRTEGMLADSGSALIDVALIESPTNQVFGSL